LFNHPNFSFPSNSAGIPGQTATLTGFGAITQTVSPQTGLLGGQHGGDSSVRMIALKEVSNSSDWSENSLEQPIRKDSGRLETRVLPETDLNRNRGMQVSALLEHQRAVEEAQRTMAMQLSKLTVHRI